MFRTMRDGKDVVIFQNFSDEWDMLWGNSWYRGFDSKEHALSYLRGIR
jgi:viroplasmin and RNaseH domain-containing protein